MRGDFEKAIDLAAARVLAIRAEHCREVNRAIRGGGGNPMRIPLPNVCEDGGRSRAPARQITSQGRGADRISSLRRSQGAE